MSYSSFNRFSYSKFLHRLMQFSDISFYKFFNNGSTIGPPGKFCIFLKASMKLIATYSTRSISLIKEKQLMSILQKKGAQVFFRFPNYSIRENIVLVDYIKISQFACRLVFLRKARYAFGSPFSFASKSSYRFIQSHSRIFIKVKSSLGYFDFFMSFMKILIH